MDINLSEFPKTREKIREVVKAQLVAIQAEMLKQIPKEMEFEIPEIIPQQVDLTIEYLLKNNFRFLYDVFDKENVILQIIHEVTSWVAEVEDEEENTDFSKRGFNSRIEAENAGFIECFKILEEKL